jgi:hypothetical protein
MADLDDLALAMPITTPHFDGYPAVLMRIPDLARLDRDELEDAVLEALLTRAQKRVAGAWLDEHRLDRGLAVLELHREADLRRMLPVVGSP